jgi:serine/threonine protein kinase
MPSSNSKTRKHSSNSRNSRNTRSNKSNNTNTNTNNSRIGKGAFGTVNRPPKKCADKNLSQYYSDKYVSKLTESFSAEKELEAGIYIRKHIKNHRDYYCLVNNICAALKEDQRYKNGEYRDSLSYMPYCGQTLDKFLSDNILTPELTWYLLDLLCSLIEGIQLLHKNKIFHLDIHMENIVYDDQHLLLIDFGNSEWPYVNLTDKMILTYATQDNDMLLNKVLLSIFNYILEIKVLDVDGYREINKTIEKIYKSMYNMKDIYKTRISDSYISKKQNEIISEFMQSIPIFREDSVPDKIKN